MIQSQGSNCAQVGRVWCLTTATIAGSLQNSNYPRFRILSWPGLNHKSDHVKPVHRKDHLMQIHGSAIMSQSALGINWSDIIWNNAFVRSLTGLFCNGPVWPAFLVKELPREIHGMHLLFVVCRSNTRAACIPCLPPILDMRGSKQPSSKLYKEVWCDDIRVLIHHRQLLSN